MSASNEIDDFASLLRRHRLAAGLSQEELAEKAGLSSDAVAALERGRRRAPRPLTVRLLATALNLSETDFGEFTESLRRSPTVYAPQVQGPPLPPDAMIGRASELAELSSLLGHGGVRLVTLTGLGGVGKTRLAVAVANEVRLQFEAGVCWVPLAARPDGPEVTEAVAAAVGLRAASDAAEVDALAEHIGSRQLLVVLDNCEHVVETCARLCTVLLQRCPRLTVLATSRELLRAPGEVVRQVQPLTVPPSRAAPEEIRDADAVRMFLARAAAHGVHPRDDRLLQVSRVCRSVQGIPLAIELAAARVNVLTIEQIADELDNSTRILSGGSRTAPLRQQTIDAALDWSYQLLSADEREFFEAVSTFSGGWTMPAAVAVFCAEETDACHERVLDLTGRLIDKSLILVDRDAAEARYSMFSVIRQYADRRLDDGGRRTVIEQRHLRHYTELAEEAERTLGTDQQAATLSRLDVELDNLRVALGRAISRELGAESMRLGAALWRYFSLRGHYSEGRDWLESALRIAGTAPEPVAPAALAAASRGAGYLAFLQCDYDVAAERLEQALALYRRLDDAAGAALTLRHLASIAREQGDYERSFQLHLDSLHLRQQLGDKAGIAWSRHYLGFVSWLRMDFERAREYSEAALAYFQQAGDGEGITWSQINLGVVALYEGDLATAERLLHQSLGRAQRLGFREGVGWSLNLLGVVARRQGRLERAIHLLDESLAEHQELGDKWRAASVLEALAAVAQEHDNTAYAAFLLGAAAAVRDTIGAPIPLCERPDTELTLAAVRDKLGDRAFAHAWGAGQATPLHAVADGYPPDTLSTLDTPW
ncbi:ATP-binding protein [Jiangella rhizosphaerae]|uniref:Helix-turn-helix domain-containing protein n=1 Tax=Jiangella rhizosphaerae TaxID=2293569 RepID=A0A418KNT1_9ACTN|nr:tetratricopeptide repeat protein [Jiangella rhizosphaerae]RIQ20667.1 helix-turn-helix domain-containing protein [Jiangella rhizosphaerae]